MKTIVGSTSRYWAKNPENVINLEAITAPPLEVTLDTYMKQGEKDVRVAHNHREGAPLGCPTKVWQALKRLEAHSRPEDCPLVGHCEEAYDAYLDGFYEAMASYYPRVRFTVPAWSDAPNDTFLGLGTLYGMLDDIRARRVI